MVLESHRDFNMVVLKRTAIAYVVISIQTRISLNRGHYIAETTLLMKLGIRKPRGS